MDFSVKTFDLTRRFKSHYCKKNATFEPTNPHAFFQEIIGRITGNISVNEFTAIDRIHIEVKDNEFFGLLGPNGSGKTTLLKMLAGLLRPTSGTAIILGYDLAKERNVIIEQVNYVAGMLTGGVWCDPNLSAKKNLQAVASLFNIPIRKVDEVLEFVGLGRVKDARIGTFSSGMTARLVVAFGLLREASLYLMDEPTIGISIEAAREIQTYLKEHLQKELKATIIYATNNVLEAEKLCDRVAILNEGTNIVCDKPKDLVRSLKRSEVIEVKLLNSSREMLTHMKEKEDIINVTAKDTNTREFMSHEDVLRIRVYDAEESLPGIVDLIVKECNGKIRNIKVFKPNLEDVFIQYVTGKDINKDDQD